jgi:hypothetical protein
MQDVRRLKAVEDLLGERSGRTGDCLKPRAPGADSEMP